MALSKAMFSADSTRAMAVTDGNQTCGSSALRWRVPAAIANDSARCSCTVAIPTLDNLLIVFNSREFFQKLVAA